MNVVAFWYASFFVVIIGWSLYSMMVVSCPEALILKGCRIWEFLPE